jgi:hypothetical protein
MQRLPQLLLACAVYGLASPALAGATPADTISTIAGGTVAGPSPGTSVAITPTGVDAFVSGGHEQLLIGDDTAHGVRSLSDTGLQTLVAGGARPDTGDGGPSLVAGVEGISSVGVDAHGDMFIDDAGADRVRFVPATSGTFFGTPMSGGDIYTIAGDGTLGGSGDGGPATSAELYLPTPAGAGPIAVDPSGNLAIGDMGNSRVRFVPISGGTFYGKSMSAGYIYTVAGDGKEGYGGDAGPATAAEMKLPSAVALDANDDLAIADNQSDTVRLVPATAGTRFNQSMSADYIYTIAGDGKPGYNGDGKPGPSTELDFPTGVAFDAAGDIAIADETNSRVRFLSATTGSAFGHSVTDGDVYTLAGNGSYTYSGDSGPAAAAGVSLPGSVTFDASGDLIFGDRQDHRVRLIAASGGTRFGQGLTANDIYTIVGNGFESFAGESGLATSAQMDFPTGVAVDRAGDVAISDFFNDRIRYVPASSGTLFGPSVTAGDIYTVAGDGTGSYSGDGGPASAATVEQTAGVVYDAAGDLAIADRTNNVVRFVPASSGTYFGKAMTAGDIYTLAGTGKGGFSGDGGAATSAELHEPYGVGFDAHDDLVISDTDNARVRFVPQTSGTYFGRAMTADDIYTIAGTGTAGFSGDTGPATAAKVNDPGEIAVDAEGDVAIPDPGNERVRYVAATTGTHLGQAMTDGDIYTIAGDGTRGDTGDGGPASASELEEPAAAAFDAAGDLAIVDEEADVVRLIAARAATLFGQAMSANDIYTIAGNGKYGYSGDGGPATAAALAEPDAAAFDPAGDLVLADGSNNRVRLVTVAASGSYVPIPVTLPVGILNLPLPSNAFTIVGEKVKSNGAIVLKLKLPGAGTVAVGITFSVPYTTRGRHPKHRHRTVVYLTATVSEHAGGTVTITLKPRSRAARQVRRYVHTKLSGKIGFTPTGGTIAHRTFALTVERGRHGSFRAVKR